MSDFEPATAVSSGLFSNYYLLISGYWRMRLTLTPVSNTAEEIKRYQKVGIIIYFEFRNVDGGGVDITMCTDVT